MCRLQLNRYITAIILEFMFKVKYVYLIMRTPLSFLLGVFIFGTIIACGVSLQIKFQITALTLESKVKVIYTSN